MSQTIYRNPNMPGHYVVVKHEVGGFVSGDLFTNEGEDLCSVCFYTGTFQKHYYATTNQEEDGRA